MDQLTDFGFGHSVGVISATGVEFRKSAPDVEQESINVTKKGSGLYASMKSHKVIQVVFERIYNSSEFTFDYCCMVTIAAMIAAGV